MRAYWTFFRENLPWSSHETKHIFTWMVMWTNKTADIGQLTIQVNCTSILFDIDEVMYCGVCVVKGWDNQTIFFLKWGWAGGDGNFRVIRGYASWIFYFLHEWKWMGHSEYLVSTRRSHYSYHKSSNESWQWNISGMSDLQKWWRFVATSLAQSYPF